MPVTFAVNRNVQGIPQLASNLMPISSSTMYDAIADSSGNFYTCGTYTSASTVPITNGVLGAAPAPSGSATCGLTTATLPAAYVVKYNATGIAQWSWSFSPTTAGSALAYNIITDPTYSNIYVLVNYSTTAVSTVFSANTSPTSSTGPTTNITIPISATFATMIVKLNSFGVVQWVSQYQSNSNDLGYAMSVDILGNLFVCGSIAEVSVQAIFNIYNGLVPQAVSTSVTTSSITVTLPALTNPVTTAYVLKYAANGVASTAAILGQPAASGVATAFSTVVDPTNTFVYVVGQYINSATLSLFNGSPTGGLVAAGTPTIPLTSTTPMGFVIKYTTAALAFVSASIIGNGATTNNIQIYGSAIAPNGNFYVCGSYTSSVITPIYNAPVAIGASQLAASNTISLPISAPSCLVTGFVVKYNTALVAQYGSVINPVGTTTTSAMSNVYSVSVDSSDVNFFAGIRYVSSNIVSGVNVTNLITSTAGTGVNTVILPAAPASASGYIRYFLGNSLHATTLQNTSNIFNGTTIGTIANTSAPLTIFEDPTMTSVYLATSFINNGPMAVPNAAVTNGLAQPGALFNLAAAGAAVQTPIVIKFS